MSRFKACTDLLLWFWKDQASSCISLPLAESCTRSAWLDATCFKLSQLHKLIMEWNVMMEYTNYQTPRSECWLFYPIFLMWTVKNCLKCLLNLLCNTAAMFPAAIWVIGRPCVAHSCSDLLPSSYVLGRRAELRINFSSLFQSDQENPFTIFYFSHFFMTRQVIRALVLCTWLYWNSSAHASVLETLWPTW